MNKEFLEQAADILALGGTPASSEPDDPNTSTEDSTAIDALLGQEPDRAQRSEPDVVDEPTIQTPDPEVQDPEPVVDERDSVIESLRAQLLELTKAMSGEVWPAQQQPAQDVTTDPNQQQQQQTQTPAPPVKSVKSLDDLLKEVSYLNEEEIDSIIDDPKLINTALNRARQDMITTFQAALPSIVTDIVNQQLMVQRVVESFYEINSDLRPYADFVEYKMSQIESANPNLTYGEIFTKTAEECRKGLGLKNPEQRKRDESTDEKPAFTASKRSTTKRPVKQEDKIFDENARDILETFNL